MDSYPPAQPEMIGARLIAGMADIPAATEVDLPMDRLSPADAIAQLIADHGGSVKKAAESVGLPRETLRDYHNGKRSIPGTVGRKLTVSQARNFGIISNMRAKFGARAGLSPAREAQLRAVGSSPATPKGTGEVIAVISGKISVGRGYARNRKSGIKLYDHDLKPGALNGMVDAYLGGADAAGVFAAFAAGVGAGWTVMPPLDVSEAAGGRLMI